MYITEREAKKAGVKREVYQAWHDVMQALWTSQISLFRIMQEDKRHFPEQGENEITVGKRFCIRAIIINNSYIEAELWEQETQLAGIRYKGNTDIICQCFRVLIKSYV